MSPCTPVSSLRTQGPIPPIDCGAAGWSNGVLATEVGGYGSRVGVRQRWRIVELARDDTEVGDAPWFASRQGLLPSSSDLSRPTGRQDLRRPASRTNKSACAEMLFLPACPTRSASPAGPGRNFWFHFFRNRDCLSPSRLVARGVRVVTDVRGDAMAATGCARRARVGTDMKWQRPDTPMLVLRSRRRRCAARIMVAREPGAPGRLPISVKTIAQGMPGRSG